MRPGVDVISRAQPAPLTIPTDTGVGFAIGAAAQGPITGLVHSLTEYTATFGQRQGATALYDAVDVYFREGANRLYIGNTAPTITVAGEGAAPPGPTQSELEAMNRADLDAYAETLGLDPADYATKADELAAVQEVAAPRAVDVGIAAALAALNKDLGPGQVFIADPALAVVADNQAALLAHAQANDRVALLSVADGTAASIIAAGTALHATANARYGAAFAPSATVPGVTPGTTRTVPWAVVVAGIIGRNDSVFTPNQAAAGDNGRSLYALKLAAAYTDTEYGQINDAGVNMGRTIYNVIENYGFRSCVDPTTADAQWLEFGHARLNMAICAEADAIGEHYVFSQIDGRGITLANFGSELSAMLQPYWESGALYGATAGEAFQVNVGPSVNTPATIANGELHAQLLVRMSHMTEWVVIEVVKVATTQALATATALAA